MIDVAETLRETEILLTGGNGFLGKVVLGLLLDRYPEFKHVHLLIRPQPTLSGPERFYRETLRSPALASIVKKRGEEFLRNKVTVWEGDVSWADCGLEPGALEPLAGRVGLVLNCAGRVDFFPPLDESLGSNVDGVEHLIGLARRVRAKLLHVSTCFVCGTADGLIEETEPILGFYPRRKGPDDLSFRHTEEISYCRKQLRLILDSEGFDGEHGARHRSGAATERLIELGRQRAAYWGWVNTYTYAKSLGEQVLAAQPEVEYAIVRPAIIESAWRFPFPGWIEGSRTAAPLVLMALGGMKEWPARADIPLEVVPVDLAASAILVVAAALLNGHRQPVYQLGTADVHPFSLERIVTLLDREARRRGADGNGPPRAAWVEKLVKAGQGRSPRFISAGEARARRLRLQKRIGQAEAVIARLEKTPFPGEKVLAHWSAALRTLSLQASFRAQTIKQYLPFILHNRTIFESENIRLAHALVSERDRKLLPWDPECIDWKQYWVDHQIQGIEKWTQPEAARHWAFRL